ncbi:hypothetical protein BKM31_22250 [[Actinomadura] parvosata subsp. kistnae]|uniref:Uncharacterized protein n=1 Tax=[Actinomadura] parvosata subsp. kistnae TaxID=1909395 RepID=A0A1V0A0W5_9ACTN|nr:hypothetical protein BKM31_22250 [Nonomuraea sp. ATCC 55076]
MIGSPAGGRLLPYWRWCSSASVSSLWPAGGSRGVAMAGCLASTAHHQVVPAFMAPTPTKSGGPVRQPAGICGGRAAGRTLLSISAPLRGRSPRDAPFEGMLLYVVK